MPTVIACPMCAARLTIPDEWDGHKARCPGCKGSIPVPVVDPRPDHPPPAPLPRAVLLPAVRLAPATAAAGGGEPPADDEPPAADRPKRKKKPKRPRGVWGRVGLDRFEDPSAAALVGCLGVGIAGMLVVVFGLGVWSIVGGEGDGADTSAWVTHTEPGRYTVAFPTPPERGQQPVGDQQFVTLTSSPHRGAVFSVGHLAGELPPHRRALPTDRLLDESCDGSLAGVRNSQPNATVTEVSRTPVQLGGHPGKELVLYVRQGRGHMIYRVYKVNNTACIIVCGGRGFRPGQQRVGRFFDSFKLQTDDPPAPPAAE